MSTRKPPILHVGALSGRVYIVTAYREVRDDSGNVVQLVANTKFDVTEQFEAIQRLRQQNANPST